MSASNHPLKSNVWAFASCLLLSLFVLAFSACNKKSSNSKNLAIPNLSYPISMREDVADTLHGVSVKDPYRWLELDKEEKDEKVTQWMDAQSQLASDYLAALPHRKKIAERLKELYYIESVNPPIRRGGRYFFSRRLPKQEKTVVYRRDSREGRDQVLLDPNTWSQDGSVSLGKYAVNWQGSKVAYQVKENNADEATLYVKDVATGKKSQIDVISGAKFSSPSWTPSGDGFYYTWHPTDPKIGEKDRPGMAEVRFHKLGTDPAMDKVIYPATGDSKIFLSGKISRDGRFIVLTKWHGWSKSEIFIKDLESATPVFKPFFVGKEANGDVWVWKGYVYIATNDNAPNMKLLRTKINQLEEKYWQEIVAERPDAVLEQYNVVGGKLVVSLMKNASNFLEVRDLDGKFIRNVELPGIGSSSGIFGNEEDDLAYYTFASFTQPPQIYETSVSKGTVKLWKEISIPVDASLYEVKQVWYPSKDGTKVSMFIVVRKDIKLDGNTPFLLYGYGGFLSNMTPYFSTSIYPMLERGMGYAVPNLRGGGEYGEKWHQGGMLLNKQNTFDDFIGAAEYLISKKYTAASKLAIRGGSNGGLLVGAAVTQRPELFKVVVCSVPLLDMVRYHLFGLGQAWIPEYGSSDNQDQFKAIYRYSPYHHVKKGTAYPSTLFMSADNDDRVDPMHARKMAAAMQYATSAKNPILLRIESKAGHGGGGMVKKWVESGSDWMAFVLDSLGV